jgi:hypothetical protein
MTKTKPDVALIIFEIVYMAGDGSPAGRRSPAVMYGRSVFVITFSKIISRHELNPHWRTGSIGFRGSHSVWAPVFIDPVPSTYGTRVQTYR